MGTKKIKKKEKQQQQLSICFVLSFPPSLVLIRFSFLTSYAHSALVLLATIPREREKGKDLSVLLCILAGESVDQQSKRVNDHLTLPAPSTGLYITNRFIIAEELVRIGKMR
jgi:hypothetical protein